jgi:hypothetical protein
LLLGEREVVRITDPQNRAGVLLADERSQSATRSEYG